jgi:phosphohistidine phosphatase
MILLVHHGDAVPPDIDTRRPLSSRGIRNAERLANAAVDKDFYPAAVWHSGKLRARQTAEVLWRVCNPFAEFGAVRGLQPGDSPEITFDRIAGETRQIAIIGHIPHLARLLGRLIGDESVTDFPPHGIVALQPDGEGGWQECWRLEEPRETT